MAEKRDDEAAWLASVADASALPGVSAADEQAVLGDDEEADSPVGSEKEDDEAEEGEVQEEERMDVGGSVLPPSHAYFEESEVRRIYNAEHRERMRTATSALSNPLLPASNIPKPSTSQQQQQPSGSGAGGGSVPPPPAPPGAAKRKRPIGKRKRGKGLAAVVALAAPDLEGVPATAYPAQIGYPDETVRYEPWQPEHMAAMTHSDQMSRKERDASHVSEWRGPILDGMPLELAPYGYGQDGDNADRAGMYLTSRAELDRAAAEGDTTEIEGRQNQLRLRQLAERVANDEAFAGSVYPDSPFDQLPANARALFERAKKTRKRYEKVVTDRAEEMANWPAERMSMLLKSTGVSGPVEKEPGVFHLRGLITAVTTQHIQVLVFGEEGINCVNEGIGLTPAELAKLKDRMAVADAMSGPLLRLFQKNFQHFLLNRPLNWQQCALISTVVTARVKPMTAPENADPAAGRIWYIVSLEPANFDVSAPLAGAEAMDTTSVEKDLLLAEPDTGFAGFAVVTCNKSAAQLASPHLSGTYDYIFHLGIEKSGPVGVYRHSLCDPLQNVDESKVSFERPSLPDHTSIVDGTIVAFIGVRPQIEMHLRGMKEPHPLLQITQFCPIATEDVQRLMHVMPRYYGELNPHKQLQFLQYMHSFQLAVTQYHNHMTRVNNAKARIVGNLLQLVLMDEVNPIMRFAVPVLAPRDETLEPVFMRRIAQNEDCRIQEDDLVRILVPKNSHLQARTVEAQEALLGGSDLAWEHSIIGRCTRSSPSVGRVSKNTTLCLIVEFMPLDRPLLYQIARLSCKSMVLEPVSREQLSEKHFLAMGSSLYMARLFWSLYAYEDLSVASVAQPIITDREWVPPRRTDFEGLPTELCGPPGQTIGQGAASRGLLGLQQVQKRLTLMDGATLDMQEVASYMYENRAFPEFMCMNLAADELDEDTHYIKPTQEEVAIAVSLHGFRPTSLVVTGGPRSGKSTLCLLSAYDYLMHGRRPFRCSPTRVGIRRVMILCLTAPAADAMMRKVQRLVLRQPRPPIVDERGRERNPPNQFYGACDRGNPICALRFCGARPIPHWDDLGNVAHNSMAHFRLESYLRSPQLPDIPPGATAATALDFPTLEMAYAEYRRIWGVELGQPVPLAQKTLQEIGNQWEFPDYATTHALWKQLDTSLKEYYHQPNQGPNRELAAECERASFVASAFAFAHVNPNLIVGTPADLRSPLLRCLSPCDIIYVDDAQQIPFPAMLPMLEYLHEGNRVAKHTQLVLVGNDNARLPESFGYGDAFAARRTSMYTNMVRSMTAPCLPNQPHARLATVHSLTRQFMVPKDVSDWATYRAVGAIMPPPERSVWEDPMPPKFVHQIGLSASWTTERRTLELVDLQHAISDLRHPLYGYVNAVQHIQLVMVYEVARQMKSYSPDRAMIVMSSREAARFLRQFVAMVRGIASFPPVYSYEEAAGHSADLVIIGATTIPDSDLIARMVSGDEAARRKLIGWFGWLGDARSFLDICHRAHHKLFVLANLSTMNLLQSNLWHSLQTHCVARDSSWAPSYTVLQTRTMIPNLIAVVEELRTSLEDHLAYAHPVDVLQLKVDLAFGRHLEVAAPIHPLLCHTPNTIGSATYCLTPEARYCLHLRRAENKCLAWRVPFIGTKVTLPKQPTRSAISHLESEIGEFVALGSTSIYFTISSPESFVVALQSESQLRPVTADKSLPAIAKQAFAQSAAQEEPEAVAPIAPMETEEARKSRESMTHYAKRYGLRQGAKFAQLLTSMDPSEAPSTPVAASSSQASSSQVVSATPSQATSVMPSSAEANVSSAGSATYVRWAAPRGCYLAGTASEAALQLYRTMPRQVKRGGSGAKKARPNITSEELSSALSKVMYPGAEITQKTLMPPPAVPVLGVVKGGIRSSSQPPGRPPSKQPEPQPSSAVDAPDSMATSGASGVSSVPGQFGSTGTKFARPVSPHPFGAHRGGGSTGGSALKGKPPYTELAQTGKQLGRQMGIGYASEQSERESRPVTRAPRTDLFSRGGRGGGVEDRGGGSWRGMPPREFRRTPPAVPPGPGAYSRYPEGGMVSEYLPSAQPPQPDTWCAHCGSMQHLTNQCLGRRDYSHYEQYGPYGTYTQGGHPAAYQEYAANRGRAQAQAEASGSQQSLQSQGSGGGSGGQFLQQPQQRGRRRSRRRNRRGRGGGAYYEQQTPTGYSYTPQPLGSATASPDGGVYEYEGEEDSDEEWQADGRRL